MHSSSHAPTVTAQSSNLTALDHLARLQQITAAAKAAPQTQPRNMLQKSNEFNGNALSTTLGGDSIFIANLPVMTARSNEVDPTTILEWPLALRHVSKLGFRGDDLMIGVKQVCNIFLVLALSYNGDR
jgi:hypothetical protein